MFSGIIEDVGRLVAVRPRGNGRTLVIETRLPLGPGPGAGEPGKRVKLGDSIAVMGVCLTAEELHPAGDQGGTFVVAAGKETLDRTTTGLRQVGDRVHLERALRLGDRLDGHIVAGHVDGIGRVRSIQQQRESWVIWVDAPADLARFVADKGSITIDGISLTVNEVQDGPSGSGAGCAFRVNIIPFTVQETAISGYRAGTQVNLEVDVLARYLERLLTGPGGPATGQQARLTPERLHALGFGAPPRGGDHG
ncbi:MAG: riboflavin synthase [Alphaproteobacteria bacterium]|nr:riboflavin synthase [Alphaproteobacteria bacterium]